MKRIIGAAALAAVLFAGIAEASTSTSVAKTTRNTNDQVVGLCYTIPTLAQNAIDTTVVNVAGLVRPYVGASSVPTMTVINAFSSSTAGDSINVSIDVGPTASGPWLQVVNFANVYTCSGATPMRLNNVVNTTLIPAPYWRLRLKSKGSASLSGKLFYLFFPSVQVLAG